MIKWYNTHREHQGEPLTVLRANKPSAWIKEIHQDRPTFSHTHSHTCYHTSHSHTHTHTQTYQKASQGVFLSLSKSHDFIFRLVVTEKPTTDKPQLFRQGLQNCYSINSVQIIYFIYTLNAASAETTRDLQHKLMSIDLLSFCAHFCLLEFFLKHQNFWLI